MDFPKSVPGVGLQSGQFVDENPATGLIGSLIPAAWANGVTLELINLIRRAGLEPSEAATDQLGQAVDGLIAAKIDGKLVRALSVGRQLTDDDMGLLLIDSTSSASTYTLPVANAELGIREVFFFARTARPIVWLCRAAAKPNASCSTWWRPRPVKRPSPFQRVGSCTCAPMQRDGGGCWGAPNPAKPGAALCA